MICLTSPAAFKCYHNFHKVESISSDNLFYKMVIHVYNDLGFRRYQKRWGTSQICGLFIELFFLDINLFKANKERAAEISKSNNDLVGHVNNGNSISTKDGLANEDVNQMTKLKFFTYKLRTFLIHNGLSIFFKDGPAAILSFTLVFLHVRFEALSSRYELSKFCRFL